MAFQTLDHVGQKGEKPKPEAGNKPKGHWERVDDLPGKLWYPEAEGDSIEGIFMELRESHKYDSLIVIKEAPEKLTAEHRDITDETIVPGWAVLHKRFATMKVGTKVRIVFNGEKATQDGKGKAKQFEVNQWVDE